MFCTGEGCVPGLGGVRRVFRQGQESDPGGWRAVNQIQPLTIAKVSRRIHLNARQIPEFKSFEHPVASFVAWLYLNTGVRAAAHNAGMQKNTIINDLVRLAIPVGLKRQQVDEV